MTNESVFTTSLRTHRAGSLRAGDAGARVSIGGWVHRSRDLGGVVFTDVRDRGGIVQVSFDPRWTPAEVMAAAGRLTSESVVIVEGEVAMRPDGQRNAEMETGDVEIRASSVRVVGPAETPPIQVARGKGEKLAAEELRLRYRHLDLRRPELRENIELRHRLMQATRSYFDSQGFLEIETPILTKPTPEGARDYLVPSRVHPGEFYALPQSPQLYKQLLMIAGFDRYFQIARCFRDEDLRADRQPEFTQIDVEASFVGVEDVIRITEGLVSALLAEAAPLPRTNNQEPKTPFRRMTYAAAMENYGTDHPDLRYGLELFDVSELFGSVDFNITKQALASGGRVRGLRVPGAAAWSRKQLDQLEQEAKTGGAAGLLRMRRVNGALDGPLAKHLSEGAAAQLAVAEGDLIAFVAAPDRVSAPSLDRVRQECARRLALIDESKREFLWVTDFPLFHLTPDTRHLESVNHPFTSPNPDDLDLLDSEPEKVRALAYDLILNGTELGSGSIRISDPALQSRVFRLLGMDDATAAARFGFLLEALKSGAPPHGGIAFGFDRIAMLFAGGAAQSLRDVIAFPKTTAARALFEGAPTPISNDELNDLHIRIEL